MSRLLVLKHAPYEGPAAIAEWAASQGHELTEHAWYETPQAPTTMPDALVVMGGPMNVDEEDAYQWLATEKEFIRQIIAAEVPILGICLGAQLIAAALGKRVFPNDQQELGWLPLSRTDAASRHPALSVFPDQLSVFHWHGDTFELPDGAILLGSTEGCLHQGFAVGNCIGLQFHIEIDQACLQGLITENRLPAWEGPFIASAESILSDAEQHQTPCRETLFQLLDRWV